MIHKKKCVASTLKNDKADYSIITKIILLGIFVLSFFVFITIYTYIFARMQNITSYYLNFDVVGMPLIAPISLSSIVWFFHDPLYL